VDEKTGKGKQVDVLEKLEAFASTLFLYKDFMRMFVPVHAARSRVSEKAFPFTELLSGFLTDDRARTALVSSGAGGGKTTVMLSLVAQLSMLRWPAVAKHVGLGEQQVTPHLFALLYLGVFIFAPYF
jgi:hypothetical protein